MYGNADENAAEDYHRDPGKVNIHQFYPMLDHSFNQKQSAKKSRTQDTLLAIVEEDSKSEQTGSGSLQGTSEVKNTIGLLVYHLLFLLRKDFSNATPKILHRI